MSSDTAPIRAVLFDKDGTLIDFMHTWYPVFRSFTGHLARKARLDGAGAENLARHLGDTGEAFAATSVFAHGSFEDIFLTLADHAPGLSLQEIEECFAHALVDTPLEARPIGDASATVRTLKARGYVVGVATADREASARATLASAGLLDLFDFVGAEDMVEHGKPAPDLMDLFCRRYDLEAAQVAMVGDTWRDREFARKSGAGLFVFVRTSFPDPASEADADLVLADVNELPAHLPDPAPSA